MLKGTYRDKHSEACRKRLEKVMQNEDKVKHAKKKVNEFYDRAIRETAEWQDKIKKRKEAEQNIPEHVQRGEAEHSEQSEEVQDQGQGQEGPTSSSSTAQAPVGATPRLEKRQA